MYLNDPKWQHGMMDSTPEHFHFRIFLIWAFCHWLILHASKMTVIGKMRAPYEERILSLQWSVMSFPAGSAAWMEAIIQNWFGFASPKSWQIQNTLHLYHGTDVFLTSSTGSGKTILMLASVIAQSIMDRPHITSVIYTTRALMDDQVRFHLYIENLHPNHDLLGIACML